MVHYTKNVWLDEEGEKELGKARIKFLDNEPKNKPFDYLVIKEALKVYNNG